MGLPLAEAAEGAAGGGRVTAVSQLLCSQACSCPGHAAGFGSKLGSLGLACERGSSANSGMCSVWEGGS